MPIEKEHCKVGMRVQDTWGLPGTVRWIGRMEKAAKPPREDVGTYAAVEFDEPHGGMWRCDGMWNGTRYCTSPPLTVEFIKPRDLSPEMNVAGIAAVRAKFGPRVAHMDDPVIVKFLIARKYEMPKVFEMIENHLVWEAEFKPDPDEFFPPEMVRGYPVGFGGHDKEGNILYFERPGNGGAVHPKDWVKEFGVARICRWHTAILEEGRRRIKDSGYRAKRITTVIDISRIGDTDGGVRDFAKAIAKIDQDHYPEHLAKMFIINAGSVFTAFFRLIRLFLDDRTKTKINVLGEDYREELLKHIDLDQLPAFAGGSNEQWMSRGGVGGGEDPRKIVDPSTTKVELVPDVAAAAADGGSSSPSPARGDSSPAAGEASPVAQ